MTSYVLWTAALGYLVAIDMFFMCIHNHDTTVQNVRVINSGSLSFFFFNFSTVNRIQTGLFWTFWDRGVWARGEGGSVRNPTLFSIDRVGIQNLDNIFYRLYTGLNDMIFNHQTLRLLLRKRLTDFMQKVKIQMFYYRGKFKRLRQLNERQYAICINRKKLAKHWIDQNDF